MLNWKGLNSQGASAAGGATLLEAGELRSDGGAASAQSQSGGFELRFILPFTREQVWIELTLTLTLILT